MLKGIKQTFHADNLNLESFQAYQDSYHNPSKLLKVSNLRPRQTNLRHDIHFRYYPLVILFSINSINNLRNLQIKFESIKMKIFEFFLCAASIFDL